LTGNADTATALAANGANCAAGSFPLGVNAAGVAESCTVASSGVIYSGSRTIGAAVNDWVNLGSVSYGKGTHVRVSLSNHFSDNVGIHVFEFDATYYLGSDTGWVEIPLSHGVNYNSVQTIALDVKHSANGVVELRIRRLGGGLAAGGVSYYAQVEYGTLTDSTTSGSSGTVASGYLGQLGWKFPTTANKFDATTQGMFIDNSGQVGIGTTAPTKKLEVSDGSKGITFDPTAASPTINTTANTNVTITSSGGSVIIRLG